MSTGYYLTKKRLLKGMKIFLKKKKAKILNMLVNVIEIVQKMKNKGFWSVEKSYLKTPKRNTG